MSFVRVAQRCFLSGVFALVCVQVALAQNAVTQPAAVSLVPQTHIRVYFTPGDSAELAIVEQLLGAKDSILIQAYSFTNPAIASALAEAPEAFSAVYG